MTKKRRINRQITLDYLALAVEKIQEVYDFLDDPQYELGYLAALDSLFHLTESLPQRLTEHCHQHARHVVHELCTEALNQHLTKEE